MKKITTILMAVVLLVAGCGNDERVELHERVEVPEPLGQSHLLEVAREFEVLNPLNDIFSDAYLVGMGQSMCNILYNEGIPESAAELMTMTIGDMDMSGITDPAVALATVAVLRAAVPAFCPLYITEMEGLVAQFKEVYNERYCGPDEFPAAELLCYMVAPE